MVATHIMSGIRVGNSPPSAQNQHLRIILAQLSSKTPNLYRRNACHVPKTSSHSRMTSCQTTQHSLHRSSASATSASQHIGILAAAILSGEQNVCAHQHTSALHKYSIADTTWVHFCSLQEQRLQTAHIEYTVTYQACLRRHCPKPALIASIQPHTLQVFSPNLLTEQ